MRYFYDNETGVVIDADQLREIWENDDSLRTEYPVFTWYLNACLDRNNGVLTEI